MTKKVDFNKMSVEELEAYDDFKSEREVDEYSDACEAKGLSVPLIDCFFRP